MITTWIEAKDDHYNADENLILGPLSGEEIDVVRQHRASLAAPTA